MKSLKKIILSLILTLMLLSLGGVVFAAAGRAPLTLKTGGPGNTVHVIKSWDALRNETFGNGDTINLQLEDISRPPQMVIAPSTLTDLKLKGTWSRLLVLEGTVSLTLEDGFVSKAGIGAEHSLTLNISGEASITALYPPLEMYGASLTIDGQGVLNLGTAAGDALVSGYYLTVHHKGADIINTTPFVPLFHTSSSLSFTNDGGSITSGGIFSEKTLKTTLNGGVLDFRGTDFSLESEAGISELTVNNGCIYGSDGYDDGLSVSSITVNGGNIIGSLKCGPPDGLLYYHYNVPPVNGAVPAFAQADIYNDKDEHRPALLDEDGALTSYFPEDTWYVRVNGQDAGSFTVDPARPQSPEMVQSRVDAMQNGDTLDLSLLEEEAGKNLVIRLPDTLTNFTVIGNADHPLNLIFDAVSQTAPVTVALKDISLNEADGEPLFKNLADTTFVLEGAVNCKRPLLNTTGGRICLTGSGALTQTPENKDQPLIYATGDACLDVESGTYTLNHQLMGGDAEVNLGYSQKGGAIQHKGGAFIKSTGSREGDLTVSITNGTMNIEGSEKAFTADGSLIYKQAGGTVQGGGLLQGDIVQFALIDGEISLSSKNAIAGGTVNVYIGGGVMTIDGKDGYAIDSETGGAYIQNGGTLITRADNPVPTLNIENHAIKGGSIFATFREPIEEGRDVLYEVHSSDGSLAPDTDVVIRGPVSFSARTNAAGLLHMYLPEGSYQVLQGDTLLGTFDADIQTIAITSWQQLDSLLKNTDGSGLRDDDIVDLSAMSGDSGGVYNIALPTWISRAHFTGKSGKFINARFSLADGRDKAISLTIENLYLNPDEGHAIDIAQPAPMGSSLILAGDNSIKINRDITAAGIHVDDATWRQSDEWFEANPGDTRVLNALTIDAREDDFGTTATLVVNCASSLGAAIGGGMYECAGDITIKNGDIQAIATDGAAIGGGSKYGHGGRTTIDGGNITAESTGGAPIGGGSNSDGGVIQINGGSVSCISRNTESDGTIVGSLGYARGFSTFGPAADKDNIISQAAVSVKNCNLRSYNHETSEEAAISAAAKDLANGKVKITFTGSDNKPLSGYGIIIRNADTGEEVSRIHTWSTDGHGSAGLVYTYLPDGNYRFESAGEPGKTAVSDRYPDGVISAGGYLPTEGIVLKFK